MIIVIICIKVVEEPYTMREARIHVRHVRDLLKSVEPIDAYNGADGASLSFLNTVTAVRLILFLRQQALRVFTYLACNISR